MRRPSLVPVVPEDQRPFPVRKGKFHFLILVFCYLMAVVLAFILNVEHLHGSDLPQPERRRVRFSF